MKLKSTGLGATELLGDLTDIQREMSGVIMKVKIKKPVVWRVRVFISPQDLRRIVWHAIKPQNVWYVTKALCRGLNPAKQGFLKRTNTSNEEYADRKV